MVGCCSKGSAQALDIDGNAWQDRIMHDAPMQAKTWYNSQSKWICAKHLLSHIAVN